MPYRVAGIDVHKKMLAVVVADVEVDEEYRFERLKVGTTPVDPEQRLWRTVRRRKYQITRNRVQLHNRLESLLEEAHIKLSSLVTDLLGTSARRMLQAFADGETDPATVATRRTRVCVRRPRNCPTPAGRARRSIPSIAGC